MYLVKLNVFSRQRGYSILELAIVLSVLTLLTIQFIPLQDELTDTRAEQYTLQGLHELANAAKAFYVETGSSAWPADLDALLDANYLPGYSSASGRRYNNGYGNPFQLGSVTNSLVITTQVADPSNAQAIASAWGPLASFDATTPEIKADLEEMQVTVLRPGYEVSHDALLPRDGSRPMVGSLDMQNNDVLDGNAIYSNSVETTRVNARDSGTGLVQTDTVETTLISAETFEYKN